MSLQPSILCTKPHKNKITSPSFAKQPIVQSSLSNSVSGIALAGAYLRSTGDTEWFTQRPALLGRVQSILDAVLQSRTQQEQMLFPSMFFSDGEARGDFHTGSNIAAWFAFSSAAQLAQHAYVRPELARYWQGLADQIRASLESRCATGGMPARFVEGSNMDGNKVAGHDGEESETTLMPFYGFCPADDSRLLQHADLSFTPENPWYAPQVDAIWWFNEHWSSATFPGWVTHLAGAADEWTARQRLKRIQQLTDLDGSIWWWPYPYGSTDPNRPERAHGARKCAWAAGVYLLTFVTKFVGLQVDALAREVSFAPLSPWPRFSWKGLHYGTTTWSVDFRRTRSAITASLLNHNPDAYGARLRVPLPAGCHVLSAHAEHAERIYSTTFYGRPALELRSTLAAGASLKLQVNLRAAATPLWARTARAHHATI